MEQKVTPLMQQYFDIKAQYPVAEKLELNRQKYPVEKAKGAFGKYTKLSKAV